VSEVNNNIATLSLDQFDVPLNLAIISAGQTWANRQKLQYAALKGLMKDDFLGLQDAYEQRSLYSATNTMILTPAWKSVEMLAMRNRNLLLQLTMDPQLGMMVGQELEEVAGLGDTFSVPASILEDNSALESSIGS